MSLRAGQKLAQYEIRELIGKGGMGEVYRARDTKLGRDVAAKILPEEFARDKGRLDRFEREAHLLAPLNHPNIATLHGLEEHEGQAFLVMELVEGETLADRIARGPIPVDDAMPLFIQVSEGLEAAHEKGIIHRDLKPSNIKIAPNGKPKILDFGLAKTLTGRVAREDLSKSPTLTRGPTEEGAVLGTAPYMSPEQVRGRPVDARTDVWAFGCCLYEALSGKAAFDGESSSDTIANVLGRDPDWNVLPKTTPSSVRSLIRLCLRKDAEWRLHHMADVRVQMDLGRDQSAPPAEVADSPRHARHRSLGAVAILAALAGLAIWRLPSRPSERAPSLLASINLPPSDRLHYSSGGALSITPDGSRVIYSAIRDGRYQIFSRDVASDESVLLPGAENGVGPFISPDSQWVGFFDFETDALKKTALNGGTGSVVLTDTAARVGASFGPDGSVFFSDATGIKKIPASGGVPEHISRVDAKGGELRHRWPSVTPDGNYILYTIDRGGNKDDAQLVVQSIETGKRRPLTRATCGRYAPTGHLVYAREDSLLAAPFDLGAMELTGPGIPIKSGVETTSFGPGTPAFAFSNTGTLVYLARQVEQRRLVLADMEGRLRWLDAPRLDYHHPRFSPDGRFVLLSADEALYLYDLERENLMLWVSEFEDESGRRWQYPGDASWSPDGSQVAFSALGKNWSVFAMPKDGARLPKRLIENDLDLFMGSWAGPGEILYTELGAGDRSYDIYELPLDPHGAARLVVGGVLNQGSPEVSPNGKWIAYTSRETGVHEVYVQPFREEGVRQKISTSGGRAPVWSRDGSEIYYRSEGKVLAVSIATEPRFSAGSPRVLFEGDFLYGTGPPYRWYDLSPDGTRFILIQNDEQPRHQIQIVLSWFRELERLVPDGK